MKKNLILFLAVILAAAMACNLPSTEPTETLLTATQPADTPPEAVPPTETPEIVHRIGVRVVNGGGEFYDRQTGLQFHPRGYNLSLIHI